MSEKCKKCSGTGRLGDSDRIPYDCDACDGTSIDLSTCEGVPPGSDGAGLWRCRICGRVGVVGRCCSDEERDACGIRFPSRILPAGTRETLDPDPGRHWRRR